MTIKTMGSVRQTLIQMAKKINDAAAGMPIRVSATLAAGGGYVCLSLGSASETAGDITFFIIARQTEDLEVQVFLTAADAEACAAVLGALRGVLIGSENEITSALGWLQWATPDSMHSTVSRMVSALSDRGGRDDKS